MRKKVPNDVKAVIDNADHLYACEGKIGKALQAINRALRLMPDHTQALVIKGRILFAQDQTKEAWQCYERALAFDPQCSEAFLERARMQYALKHDFSAALEGVEKALIYARKDRWVKLRALCLKGNVLSAMDRDREALRCYKTALRIDPNDHIANSGLGDTFLGMEQPSKAIPYLEKALRLIKKEKNPSAVDLELTISSLAEAYNALGKYQQGIRLLESNLPRVRGWGHRYLKSLLKLTKGLLKNNRQVVKSSRTSLSHRIFRNVLKRKNKLPVT